MWPFSEISRLREENESLKRRIRSLEASLQQKEGLISCLHDEQKVTNEKLIVAESDRKMLKENLDVAEYDVDTLNKDLDFFKNVEVTPEFLSIEENIRNRKQFVFVHGGAGTGKSTLIQWLKNRELIHVVLAPTGLTALNVGGMTIHKAFGFRPQVIFPKGGITGSLPSEFLNTLINLKRKNIATICIDEISMVRADLLDAIDLSLKNAFNTTAPFGGFQMLFVGDLFQLPPIVKQDKNDPNSINPKPFFNPNDKNYPGNTQGWRSPWFFDSDVISKYSNYQNTLKINLKKVYRQAGEKEFVEILNQLRRYENRAKNANRLNELFSENERKENSVIIVGKNQRADEYNQERLQMLQAKSSIFIGMKDGTFSDPKSSPPLPVPEKIELKIGEFVIIVANDRDKRYVNGTTAFITRFGAKGEVYVKNKNGEFDVQKNVWADHDIIWNNYRKCFEDIEVGHYSQIPLIPGYAITCHKAQGKTLDKVFIDVEQAFAPGQMYVALSRTRSPKDITMARDLTDADFRTDPRLSELVGQGKI